MCVDHMCNLQEECQLRIVLNNTLQEGFLYRARRPHKKRHNLQSGGSPNASQRHAVPHIKSPEGNSEGPRQQGQGSIQISAVARGILGFSQVKSVLGRLQPRASQRQPKAGQAEWEAVGRKARS